MGWLTKIFKGSSHRISEGDYNSRRGDTSYWEEPSRNQEVYVHNENEDIDRAIALSLLEEDDRKARAKEKDLHLEEDEQLARALQESLNVEPPPIQNENTYNPFPFVYSSGYRICAGCHNEIGHGRFLSFMGAVWHPNCFKCHACHQPIFDYEFSMSGNQPYHKSCYKEQYHPKCDVCKQFVRFS